VAGEGSVLVVSSCLGMRSDDTDSFAEQLAANKTSYLIIHGLLLVSQHKHWCFHCDGIFLLSLTEVRRSASTRAINLGVKLALHCALEPPSFAKSYTSPVLFDLVSYFNVHACPIPGIAVYILWVQALVLSLILASMVISLFILLFLSTVALPPIVFSALTEVPPGVFVLIFMLPYMFISKVLSSLAS
jgi:hypothetical protein